MIAPYPAVALYPGPGSDVQAMANGSNFRWRDSALTYFALAVYAAAVADPFGVLRNIPEPSPGQVNALPAASQGLILGLLGDDRRTAAALHWDKLAAAPCASSAAGSRFSLSYAGHLRGKTSPQGSVDER